MCIIIYYILCYLGVFFLLAAVILLVWLYPESLSKKSLTRDVCQDSEVSLHVTSWLNIFRQPIYKIKIK